MRERERDFGHLQVVVGARLGRGGGRLKCCDLRGTIKELKCVWKCQIWQGQDNATDKN